MNTTKKSCPLTKSQREWCIALFLVGVVCGVATALLTPKERTLVLLHTNDTHSHILPAIEDGAAELTGGVVWRKALIDSVRAAQPNTLVVDAGDFCQGTPFFNLYKGEVEVKAMNALGYEVATLGNHEFDNGVDQLAKVLALAKFDVVSCNLDVSQTAIAPYIKPYTLREVDGVKIAIIGVLCEPKGLIAQECYKGVIYHDPIAKSNEWAAKLRQEEGVEMVILLSHLGYEGDVALAKASRGIDVIVGGHSHTALESPDKVMNMDGKEVTIAQTGRNGARMGYIEVKLRN